MPRRRRQAGAGTTHHVMARSNDGAAVFIDDADRNAFLDGMARTVTRHRWQCLAHCLMGNHFHLAVTTVDDSLSPGMRDLLAVYARRFNRRHARVGRVFRERFTSVPVTSDEQLMVVMRYISLNPVRGGLVGDPAEWAWSSVGATLGWAPAPPFLDVAGALAVFGARRSRARSAFLDFIGQPSSDDAPGPLLGSVTSLPPVPPAVRLPSEEVLRGTARGEGILACVRMGHSQTAVAQALGITPSAVCHRLRRAGSRPLS